MNDNELMKSMPIPRTVAKMAIPSIISSLVTVVYNMADTFFVGQTGDPLQVAAVSLTNPIFILFMAFANMFGMGGSAAASISMGENNKTRIRSRSPPLSPTRPRCRHPLRRPVNPLHAADPQHLRRKHGDL
ncbi:MAG: MATE family efflux transporter [Clostridium sp.]